MSKKTLQTNRKVSPKLKTPNTALTNIIIAIIGFIGTLSVAIIGYLGVQYQVDKPIKLTETSVSSPPSSNFELSARWEACSNSIAVVLPDNISPEANSYNTLGQLPDRETWSMAPILGTTLPAILSVQNTATNSYWIKINKDIKIHFQLISPNIPNHVNLFFAGDGCGGGNYKEFTPILLSQSNNTENQVATSVDYDFFSLQPGEFDDYAINLICKEPGIYQATATLTINSSENNKDEAKMVSFEKIVCPKEYSVWRKTAMMKRSDPLELWNTYHWNGQEYIKKP